MTVNGETGRYKIPHPNTDYEQARTLYNKVYTEQQRENLIKNLAGPLSQCKRSIQEGMLANFYKVDPDYGTRLSKAIGVPINQARL